METSIFVEFRNGQRGKVADLYTNSLITTPV